MENFRISVNFFSHFHIYHLVCHFVYIFYVKEHNLSKQLQIEIANSKNFNFILTEYRTLKLTIVNFVSKFSTQRLTTLSKHETHPKQ